jgi:outer membrane lipase/esterase
MKVHLPAGLPGSAVTAALFSLATTTALGGPLPPKATPNVQSIAAALQRACNSLATPTNAQVLTSSQADLLQDCAFFENSDTSPQALTNAYNAIVGQQINALGPETKKFSSLQQDDITSRLSELRHGASDGVSLSGMDLRGDDSQLLAANGPAAEQYAAASAASGGNSSSFLDGRLGVYVNGKLQDGSKAHSKNSFAFDIKDDEVTAGADYRITNWLLAGAAFAHGNNHSVFDDDLGRLDSSSNGVNLYASVYHSTYYLDVLAGYADTDLHTDRNLNFVDTVSSTDIAQQALGATHLHELWAGLDVGDSLYWGHFFIDPQGSINFHEIRLDGFTESMSQPDAPGSGLALSYGSGVVPSLQGRLDLRLGYTLNTPWGVFQPQIHGSYIREFRDRADTFTAQFAAVGALGAGEPALIHTDTPETHYFANGGGFTTQLAHGFSAFLDYEQLKTLKTIKSHEFALGVRWQIGD